MSFSIINQTKTDVEYIKSCIDRFNGYCDSLPCLTVVFEPMAEKITCSKPILAVDGCCFYDSRAEGGKIVFSKGQICVVMNSACDKANVYLPEILPLYKLSDVMELITHAYAYTVAKNGGICLKALPISENGTYECLCAQYDTIAGKLYALYLGSEAKTDTAKTYCIIKKNREYALCSVPWNTKKNETVIMPAHIKRIVCLKRGDESKPVRLNVQDAETALRSNSCLHNINHEINDMYSDNIKAIAESIDVYTAVYDV